MRDLNPVTRSVPRAGTGPPKVRGDVPPGGAQGGRHQCTTVVVCPSGGRRRSDEMMLSPPRRFTPTLLREEGSRLTTHESRITHQESRIATGDPKDDEEEEEEEEEKKKEKEDEEKEENDGEEDEVPWQASNNGVSVIALETRVQVRAGRARGNLPISALPTPARRMPLS